MTRRQLLSLLAVPQVAKPNIVLILADDLGWADLGCYGADLHETPHLDALAREGMRFTRAYSPAPVCSPTRASLLTGKHPARLGITNWHEASANPPRNRKMTEGASRPNLPLGEVTLAERLREAGYATALVGKWHLGTADHYPEAQGFDVNIGGTFWGAPATHFAPYRGQVRDEYRYVPGLGPAPAGEYLTDRLTVEATRWIDRMKAQRQPYFLYLAHHAPHTPIEAKKPLIERYERKLRAGMNHTNAAYAAMVESLDASVGQVMRHVDRRNTLVVFTSDNGGYLESGGRKVTSNAPLRSGKGSLYEGGIRVPLIVSGPGVARGTCERPVWLTDLFPTLTGGPAEDGVDLWPLLRDPAARLERDTMHFHYPHYYPTTTPVGAIREGDWKLLEYFEDGRLELYDLASDPYEQRDVAPAQPARARQLRDKLVAWREKVGARMPRMN